ncbi:MAG: endolytic transglycosylase MltG [Cyanobacteriota bacterium]|nr:endolytic transglycosylase MltG [Cyanobacteriota bacterium]
MNTAERISRWTYYLFILPIVLAVCGWQGWSWWNWAISPVNGDSPSETATTDIVQMTIPQGTSTRQIGADLEAFGLIRSPLAWKIWASWLAVKQDGGGFQAGIYKLSPQDSLVATAAKIWQGKAVRLSFTIPEGQSRWQMASYFASLGYFSEQDFINAVSQIPREKYPWLPEKLPHLEGFLFPDTYELASDRVTPEQIIDLMLARFQEVALPLYEKGKSNTNLSLKEWATLASIVEKEAAVSEERSRIAGVFAGRLGDGMRLEADPTVEYALGIRQTPDKPLTLEQVRVDSPYNTYLNPGLPPTPIASPGLESLQAALSPEQTDFRFFVARYDGTHLFTKTLEEHEVAKEAIRQQRNALNQEEE